MARSDHDRESWARRPGFIVAAVGLENVWWFPFQVGQEGSVTLLFLCLGFVLLVGVAGTRRRTTILAGTTFLIGVPVVLLSDAARPIVVTLSETLVAQALLGIAVFVFASLTAWIVADRTMATLRRGLGAVASLSWLRIWLVRVPLLAVLLVALYLAIGDYWPFLTGDVADYLDL